MFEYIFVVLLFILSLPKINFSTKKSNLLTLDSSTSLRGLLCVLIFLNHLSGWFENKGIVFYLFSHMGSFIVGVFFFLSGFGLMKAHSEDIKFSFLLKRFVKILIPYWICEILYIVFSLVFKIPIQVDVNIKNILLSAIQRSTIVENSWYVGAILVLYIVFYISKKILPQINMAIKVTVVLIIFSLIFPSLNYWTTFFAFPLGILFGEYEKELYNLSSRKRAAAICTFTLLCVAAIGLKYYGFNLENYFYMNISDLLTSVLFSAFIYFVLTFVHLGNFALNFLGKISYEFYLLHGLGIRISYKLFGIKYGLIFAVFSLLISIVLAYLTNNLSSLIIKPIVKKIK